ncbi:hypothetical protein BpHYR1_018111 [Brachionus plicatilis]|uniref:Uncharacterized protein n=1 Tax=Brachionus plicatilis TaxID=10195 RepID=A0A3M7T1X3_BRAPC|nr:hypothetical protein BpHYR1_018111 [Brachionus plicatilis]
MSQSVEKHVTLSMRSPMLCQMTSCPGINESWSRLRTGSSKHLTPILESHVLLVNILESISKHLSESLEALLRDLVPSIRLKHSVLAASAGFRIIVIAEPWLMDKAEKVTGSSSG